MYLNIEKMSLTDHQQSKLLEGMSILKTDDRLVIKGSAGVGKTYMVNELIKQFNYRKIFCSAPTNKAVAVLKGKVDYNPSVTFLTTHSALKLKRQINYKTGAISFKPNTWGDPPLNGVQLFIIDEASMLSKELLGHIEDNAYDIKVIFIGDNKQLNPVNEDNSPVFEQGYPEIELTEIIRQGEGNPIIELSRDLPAIFSKTPKRNDVGGYIYTQDKGKIVETLAQVNGTDDLKYLAWTNRDIDSVNLMVRRRIYGNPAKIEVGETMVFNKPYGEDYFTNEEIKVDRLHVETMMFTYTNYKLGALNPKEDETPRYKYIQLKVYRINYFLNSKARPCEGVLVVHEDSEKDYNKLISELKVKCKTADVDWVDYYQFIERFADLKYNHAITVHKSQGSTYKQVIVNVKNLNFNKNAVEKKRLFYTAITRASELLILYNV